MSVLNISALLPEIAVPLYSVHEIERKTFKATLHL